MISTDLDMAARLLRQGQLVAIPTETVYGLAGNALQRKPIERIFELKGRPYWNPLIMHGPSAERLHPYIALFPDKARALATAFWPGPLTLVVEKTNLVPDLVTGGKSTVAIRVPAHPAALELMNRLDFPLAAPSANPFGRTSPSRAIHVQQYFKEQIPLVLDGGSCREGVESTIIGFQDPDKPVLLRLGSVTLEEIHQVVGDVSLYQPKGKELPVAPGMLGRHYAPSTPLIFSDDVMHTLHKQKARNIALLLFDKPLPVSKGVCQICLSPGGDLREAAAKLYDTLYELDRLEPDLIIAQKFPETGLGLVINDKLKRAAWQKHY